MKQSLMIVVILAGLMTAAYRFLPPDLQQQIAAQLNQIGQSEAFQADANRHSEPKRYKLDFPKPKASDPSSEIIPVASAYIQRMQDVQVQDEGRVVVVLPDDKQGSKHQRFIVRTADDVSVLVAHNIDLARRVKNIAQGDTVAFYGEYVWNEKGGVIHWTHRDPDGRHLAGWLKHDGITYQ
jgi:hypothetical protein